MAGIDQFSVIWVTMKPNFAIFLLGALLPLVGCGGGGTASSTTSGSGNSSGSGSGGGSTTPVWTSVAVPSLISTNSATYSVLSDGNLYAGVATGVSPNIVISILRTSASSSGTWTNITGTGLSNGLETLPDNLGVMGITGSGTILATGVKPGGGVVDVYAWNGSTTTPIWTKVTGWNGISSSHIYDFTNDSAGYTYFSPAWSGDIWRNDAPNSLNFTKVLTNLYGVTNGGGLGHTTTGGIYQMDVYNLNDGKGDMIWACGEGELDNIALSFSAASNAAYLTTAKGYTGNCTAIGKSPTTILAMRQASASLDGGYDSLTSINIGTRAATVHVASYPRTSTGFPGHLNSNFAGSLAWISGTNWILTDNDSNGTPTYLLLSTDDGNTWTDITASGAIDSSCTGANLSIGAVASSQYIYARCQSGKVLWRYGPLS